MTGNPASLIIDCECGLRYMQSAMRLSAPETGCVRCSCGVLLGEWDGDVRLSLEPEDATAAPPKIEIY